jgi:acyl-CoA dehydrogenase
MAPTEPLRLAAKVAGEVIRPAAPEVDRTATFPAAGVSALAEVGLLHAALPGGYGGAALDTATLAGIARVLARACGSTAMIWAMHQVQLACVYRHGGGSGGLARRLAGSIAGAGLVASVTSERGVGGDLRSSRTCCESHGARLSVIKAAPTVSYVSQASGFLITARRGPDSSPHDQVAVFATADQVEVTDVGRWNVLGMRGTCSPGCTIRAEVDPGQVLADPFAAVAAATMVPLSHILWSAVWIGLAEEALARAIRAVRTGRREAPDPRLADAGRRLSLLHGLSRLVIDGYEAYPPNGEPTVAFGIEVNNLKLAASTQTVRVAEAALEICGMAGYQEEGELSVARLLRDLYSARLMVSNSRLVETNAMSMLLRHDD